MGTELPPPPLPAVPRANHSGPPACFYHPPRHSSGLPMTGLPESSPDTVPLPLKSRALGIQAVHKPVFLWKLPDSPRLGSVTLTLVGRTFSF